MEFEVEKIIKKRIIDGKVEYFLKWRGYGSKENSWVSKENLECDKLLEEFELSSFRSIDGIRKMDNITYYLVKFAGRAVKEIKSSEEMRSNWPMKTIEFLQNKIEWVDPASKLKKVQDTGNERNVLGKPTSILYVSQVGRELFYWTHFEHGYGFLSAIEVQDVCPILVIDYLESLLDIQ